MPDESKQAEPVSPVSQSQSGSAPSTPPVTPKPALSNPPPTAETKSQLCQPLSDTIREKGAVDVGKACEEKTISAPFKTAPPSPRKQEGEGSETKEAVTPTPAAPPPVAPPAPSAEQSKPTEQPKAPVQAESSVKPSEQPKKQEPDKIAPKFGKNALTCSGLVVLAMLLGLGVLIYFLTISGLVRVPFFSRWYTPPAVVRTVGGSPTNWAQFRSLILGRLTDQAEIGPPYQLRISETEMSGLLNGVIAGAFRDQRFAAERTQVALTPGFLEMAVFVSWNRFLHFDLLLRMRPRVENDGTVRFETTNAYLGRIPLPSGWVMQLLGYIFSRDIGTWNIRVDQRNGIRALDLNDRFLDVTIGPTAIVP